MNENADIPLPAHQEECGICLDTLPSNPVRLPCSHKFCLECLEGWRTKVSHLVEEKTCPLCRGKIPPSKEMLAQLDAARTVVKQYELFQGTALGGGFMYKMAGLDPSQVKEQYLGAKSMLAKMEEQFGDYEEILEGGDDVVELPRGISDAAIACHPIKRRAEGDTTGIETILDWLGPPPVDKKKLNAKDSQGFGTLLHVLVNVGAEDLVPIILQLGADVNSVNAFGQTPLGTAVGLPKLEQGARLLLEWGADKSIPNPHQTYGTSSLAIDAYQSGNTALAHLLKSDLGGRRCEIVGMEKRTDLNGKTCTVTKYLPDKDRYKVVMEHTSEEFLVIANKLKRRDRTQHDCGYYIKVGHDGNGVGRLVQHVFGSKEDCQAFLALERAAAETAGAEAKAEDVAAALLADLDLEEKKASNTKIKRGKKKRNKTKGKK